ncbi:MAG TPA: DMT family transporter [Streptosporangiaceae bacterium]|nr:DMT family transporter [Streptosporangiaceae bacterium]
MMAVLLAVLGALLFALAGAAEQRAASRLIRLPAAARCAGCRQHGGGEGQGGRRLMSPARRAGYGVRRGLRLAGGFLRSPLWIAGWMADALGFGAQAGALHVGSLSVVQPLLVTTLLFSLPLATLGTRQPPRWADWAGGLAACAGLAMVLSSQPLGSAPVVHRMRLLAASLIVVAAAGGLVALAARRPPSRGRAGGLAVATGLMFALCATLTKLVGDRLVHTGIAGTASYWPAYALAVVALTGLALEQAAFAAGSLPGAMAAITITDPLVSYGFGIVGFGERVPYGAAAGLCVAGLGLLAAGIVALARSPLLHAPGAAVAPAPAQPGDRALDAAAAPAAWFLPDAGERPLGGQSLAAEPARLRLPAPQAAHDLREPWAPHLCAPGGSHVRERARPAARCQGAHASQQRSRDYRRPGDPCPADLEPSWPAAQGGCARAGQGGTSHGRSRRAAVCCHGYQDRPPGQR